MNDTETVTVETVTQSKQNYLLSKQQNAEKRKAERAIQKAKDEMQSIEKRLDAILLEMDEAATDHKKLTELYEEQSELEMRMLELLEFLDSAGEM